MFNNWLPEGKAMVAALANSCSVNTFPEVAVNYPCDAPGMKLGGGAQKGVGKPVTAAVAH